MSDKHYRPDLTEMPPQIRRLPVERGYPVPWFVERIGGHYDFRIMDGRKIPVAIKKRLCWICGQQLSREFIFPIGPMCAVNRTTAEPPSHPECAQWAARACPFLIQREQKRREGGLPEGAGEAAGIMIRRQPGVVLLWRTDHFSLFGDGKGNALIRIGPPLGVEWLREGRQATRAEVEESIKSGLPLLREECHSLQDLASLRRDVDRAMTLLPAA